MAPAVVLFDGVCILCNAFVRFAIRWMPRGTNSDLLFCAGQSDTGRRLVADAGLPGDITQRTIVLLHPSGHPPPLVKSSAVLTIGARLHFPWWLLARIGWAAPQRLRDAAYDWVAAHRYHVFGKRDRCAVPEPSQRAYFLE